VLLSGPLGRGGDQGRIVSVGPLEGNQRKKLTAHLHLLPRLGIRGSLPHLPHTVSWRGAQSSPETNLLSTSPASYLEIVGSIPEPEAGHHE
jgi:hypothetical protein